MVPCIADIKISEKDGIEIKFDCSVHKFFGTLSMLVADSLAAHAIGGYYQNFSTVERFCRFCNRIKSCISDLSCQDVFRSKEAYDAQVLEVEKNQDISKFYGIFFFFFSINLKNVQITGHNQKIYKK